MEKIDFKRLVVLASIFGHLLLPGFLKAEEETNVVVSGDSFSEVIFEMPTSQAFESVYVEYKKTGKKLILSSPKFIKLNKRHLQFLGVQAGSKPTAADFAVNRILNEKELSQFNVERRRETRAWIKGPGNKTIAFEPMKAYQTTESGNSLNFKMKTNYLLMAQADMSHLAALKIKANSIKEKKIARKKALELFEQSWANLKDAKFDRSLVGFETLKEYSWSLLTRDEREKLIFGLSLSKFHQQGCDSAYSDFKKMLRPGEFESDALYYSGLCALDASELENSKSHFSQLVERDDPQYIEESRFYLGVVAEAGEDYATAESAYLDTVDFSSKERLVKLAKSRLSLLKAIKARKKYEKKVFSFMFNTGIGYDTNALSLASSVEPSSLNLTTGASPSYMALAFLDVKNTFLYPLQQKFYYSFLMLGYTDSGIAAVTDLQSHDVGANVSWGSPINTKHTLAASTNLSFLGKIGSSSKYLTAYAVKWDMSKYKLNSEKQLDRTWIHSFKLSRSVPATPASTTANDGTAWILSGDHKLRYVRGKKGYGYITNWEYRLAKGSENTNITVDLGGHYDQPILEKSYKMNFSQEMTLATAIYYSSAASRKDFLLTSTSSLSKMLTGWMEGRFQLIYYKNFSNATSAKYGRIQANLLMTAFF